MTPPGNHRASERGWLGALPCILIWTVCFLCLATGAHAQQTLRVQVHQLHPCLAFIIDREDPAWDPGQWNREGSGAFGLGQAKPYTKMPRAAWPVSAGGRENPWVQVRWALGYAEERYGGECEAKQAWIRQGGWW